MIYTNALRKLLTTTMNERLNTGNVAFILLYCMVPLHVRKTTKSTTFSYIQREWITLTKLNKITVFSTWQVLMEELQSTRYIGNSLKYSPQTALHPCNTKLKFSNIWLQYCTLFHDLSQVSCIKCQQIYMNILLLLLLQQ